MEILTTIALIDSSLADANGLYLIAIGFVFYVAYKTFTTDKKEDKQRVITNRPYRY